MSVIGAAGVYQDLGEQSRSPIAWQAGTLLVAHVEVTWQYGKLWDTLLSMGEIVRVA